MQKKQNTWSSQWIFILAAVGAAAGLGNLWRFPYMVYENGGGAFLLAYVVVLLFVCTPMVILESSFGQKSQSEIVQALGNNFGKLGKFFGWLAISWLVILAGYYGAVIGWGFNFLVASPTIGWGENAEGFFYNNVLNISEGIETFGKFSIPVILGLIATYIAVYFSIFKGIRSVGAVVKWTVPLPFILLLVILGNTLTLEGAISGFTYFLIPDWSLLTSIDLWKNAVSQAFFSVGVGFGVLLLLGSFNKAKTPIVKPALLIVLGDTLVALIAGFAIFGTLGWMATNQEIPITEVVKSGPTLAFITFPTALSLLPWGAGFFATIFFLTILTLAIDSMFALVEAMSTTLRNQCKKIGQIKLEIWTAIICSGLFIWSALGFAGANGLYRLDIIDHFIMGHLMYIFLIGQVILIGWFLPIEKLRAYINSTNEKYKIGKSFDYIIKFVAPAIFITLYISSLPTELGENYGGYSNSAIFYWGILPCILCILLSSLLSFRKN